MKEQTCCFIGHRKVPHREAVLAAVRQVVGRLITEHGVRVFNFGSRSEFDDLCHLVVTEYQSLYPDIVRVSYHCASEYVVKKDEKARLEASWSELSKRPITLKDFDASKSSDRVQRAGRASYVERNQDMIQDSDVCVFFYKDGYKPDTAAHRSSSGKSGTKLAYEYAVKQQKNIINIAGEI